jgi:hypothetical protein
MRDRNQDPAVASRIHFRSADGAASLLFSIFWIFHASAGVVWAVRNMEEPSGPSGH